MACRLHNAYDKPLGVDLRGGETLVIPPHMTSRAIVEEALYDNHNLVDWERRGWVSRIPARMADVAAETNAPAREASMRATAKKKPTKKVGRAADASRSTKKAGKASATGSKAKTP